MTIELRSVTVDLPIYSVSAKSLRKSLAAVTIGGALFRRRDDHVSVRALDAVSMSIADGDRVALIGPNGAGKTTLLKVLAGVYTPASGYVSVKGRVSAALNVGLGLDGDLSGRENIYLLGYYRGIDRRAIDLQIDEIVEATELGTFIDLPVNTYSSGMTGRLTFAVATAFEPEVLLMDEWLLAGDHRFIQKASDRVATYVAKARVMVLASHSLAIVRDFCTKAAYLKGGRLIDFGPVEQVIGAYDRDTARDVAA